MTLLHREPPPAPQPKPCNADAYYWVTGVASQRLTCGPHLVATMNRMRREGDDPRVPYNIEPPRGKRCEWTQ